tara:strand:+ start:413 stop:712 length:300 start_codon:yes stop_codon:yes gene_type:complete
VVLVLVGMDMLLLVAEVEVLQILLVQVVQAAVEMAVVLLKMVKLVQQILEAVAVAVALNTTILIVVVQVVRELLLLDINFKIKGLLWHTLVKLMKTILL